MAGNNHCNRQSTQVHINNLEMSQSNVEKGKEPWLEIVRAQGAHMHEIVCTKQGANLDETCALFSQVSCMFTVSVNFIPCSRSVL